MGYCRKFLRPYEQCFARFDLEKGGSYEKEEGQAAAGLDFLADIARDIQGDDAELQVHPLS